MCPLHFKPLESPSRNGNGEFRSDVVAWPGDRPRRRFGIGSKPLPALVLGLVLTSLCGCLDSPIRRLWYRQEWLEDEKFGPTFHARLDELRALRSRVEDLGEEEQVRVSNQLLEALAREPSPLYRSEVVRTLAVLPTPAAVEGLRRAIEDSDPSVRIAACEAWARRGGDEALRILSQVVGSDTDLDVRLAATRGLANFKSPAAVRALGLALDDPDPALQHRAVQSLKQLTGRDLGDSVPAWRQFVQSGQPPVVEEPSIAERLRRWF